LRVRVGGIGVLGRSSVVVVDNLRSGSSSWGSGGGGGGGVLVITVTVVKLVGDQGTADSTNGETTCGTEKHSRATVLLLLALTVGVVAAITISGSSVLTGGSVRRGSAIGRRSAIRRGGTIAWSRRSVTTLTRRRRSVAAIARSTTVAARSWRTISTRSTRVTTRSVRGLRLVRRTRIRGRRGRCLTRSLPLSAASGCLNIVPSLLVLVELSSPTVGQRRAIGRRLIGGLRGRSAVLLLRSR
jgi:hypothetical protein